MHVHLKDLRTPVLDRALAHGWSFEQAVASGVFCALGDGNCDLAGFLSALGNIGYDGWATYEQDRVAAEHPHARGDAERSLVHLESLVSAIDHNRYSHGRED
jgi:sugar phosphate isomerase/epimerase